MHCVGISSPALRNRIADRAEAPLKRLATYARAASERRALTEGELDEDLIDTVDAIGGARPEPVLPFLQAVAATFGASTNLIHVECDPMLRLPLDELAALGIAASEAIANALAYAFPEGREGLIWVRVKETEGRVSLVVRDNGVGLPDLPLDPASGRGMIAALAHRLGGYARLGSAPFGGGLATVVYPRRA